MPVWSTHSRALGYEFSNGTEQWLDRISGAPATPFGAEATPGESMSFQTEEFNGRPIVRNDTPLPDNNQWWIQDTVIAEHAPNLLNGTNDYTIIALIKPQDPPAEPTNIGVLGTWGIPTDSRSQWFLSAEPDAIGGGWQRVANGFTIGNKVRFSDLGFSTAELFDWHTFGWIKRGGAGPVTNDSLFVHTDGVSHSVETVFGTNPIINSDLGENDQGGPCCNPGHGRRINFMHSGNHYHGDFAEIILYDKALTEEQLLDVDAYIKTRWFDPLPANPNGDYNNDGKVDAADYVVWRDNEGTTNTLPNDPMGGTIGMAHYNQWRANFGAGSAGSTASTLAVPEPTSTVLWTALLLGVFARTRNSRSLSQ